MPKTKKSVAKGAAVAKNIETALEKLTAACVDGEKAIAVRAKDAKSMMTAIRRLNKKRAALLKRKKTATNRLKKDGSAANKAALRATVKELAGVDKELPKLRAGKTENGDELVALKAAFRLASAYLKALATADKQLNKPKKKRRKKRAKKVAAAEVTESSMD